MMSPWELLEELGDPEQRPLLFSALGLLAALLAARVLEGQPAQSALAIAVVVGAPVLALRLGGRPGGWLATAAALGAWISFRPWHGGAPSALLVVLAHRLAWFALPPLVVELTLRDEDRRRLGLGPLHLFAPVPVMGLGVVAHLLLRQGLALPAAEREIRLAALLYGACYLVLLLIGLVSRLQGGAARPETRVVPDRAPDLEETGRFGMAARVYEREGQVDKAAQAAERAGEWERAARLYRRAGDDFNAGEMFSRAELWEEALTSYEQARSLPAAARLCVRLGHVDRAAALFEQAGNPGSAVQVLEEAGRVPTPEQYRKAGRLDQAVSVLEERGEWLRAAELCEHELHDPLRAVGLYQRAGAGLQAGRLLEAAGRREDALAAFAATPGGLVEAARVALALGRTPQASELLARLPPSQLDSVQDDVTLALVARVMLEDGRHEHAARILQGIKRRGGADGAVHLLLGRALLKKGLTDLALEELRTATSLPLAPDDETQAAYVLGCALEESAQLEEALQMYHRVLQKDLEYADADARYRKLKAALASRA